MKYSTGEKYQIIIMLKPKTMKLRKKKISSIYWVNLKMATKKKKKKKSFRQERKTRVRW